MKKGVPSSSSFERTASLQNDSSDAELKISDKCLHEAQKKKAHKKHSYGIRIYAVTLKIVANAMIILILLIHAMTML